MAMFGNHSDEQQAPKDADSMPSDVVETYFPYDAIVTVLVGPANHRFQAHKALACQYPFFKAAYEGNFQESKGILKLPHQDPAIFRFFVYWLYTRKLSGYYCPSTALSSLLEMNHRWRETPFDALVSLYLLADYLQISGLRDQIINRLIDVYGFDGAYFCPDGVTENLWRWGNIDRPTRAPSPVTSINQAWRTMSKDSHICRLLVTIFCDNAAKNFEGLQENEKLDNGFLSAAFAMAQARWLEGSLEETCDPKPGFSCNFHDHDGYPCEFHEKEEAAMGDLQESSSKVFDGPTSKADQVVPDVEPFFPFDQIVTVLVGPDRERFSIHKRLICQYPFFKTAYDGGFRESADSVVELPEHDPAIFRFFVYWLYTGKLYGHFYPQTAKPSISDIRKECQLQWQDWQGTHLPHYTTRSGKQLNNDRGQLYRLLTYRDAPFDALIGLYLLTEYLQIPGLRDEITNILVDVYANANDKLEGVSTSFWRWRNYSRPQWAPDPVPSINAAWTSSHQDSNLCRLLVTLFCDNVVLNAEEVQENERLDTEFLSAAFTMAQKRWSSGSARSSWVGRDSLCPYHEHDGNNCEFNNEKMAKA